jgi:hypothetical protein
LDKEVELGRNQGNEHAKREQNEEIKALSGASYS